MRVGVVTPTEPGSRIFRSHFVSMFLGFLKLELAVLLFGAAAWVVSGAVGFDPAPPPQNRCLGDRRAIALSQF